MGRTLGVALLLAGLCCLALADTDPSQTQILLAFKEAMLKRPGYQWGQALESWVCPTPTSNAEGSCNPCGTESWWGHFEHIACRDGRKGGDGFVTNVHITDYNITGEVPIKELCPLKRLKEFDLDGGQLTGPIPEGLATCFPALQEIDLSYNKLTGTVPSWVGQVKDLAQFKVENNRLTGSLPEELGDMKAVKWLRFADNDIVGELPASLERISSHLVQFTVDSTQVGGDLYPLSGASLINTGTASTGLCGMVPVGVRFAHGFNHYRTGLGLPCPEEAEAGWTDLSEQL